MVPSWILGCVCVCMCLCLSISDVCWVEIERSFKIKIVNELMEVSCEEVTKGIQVLRGRSAPPHQIFIYLQLFWDVVEPSVFPSYV